MNRKPLPLRLSVHLSNHLELIYHFLVIFHLKW